MRTEEPVHVRIAVPEGMDFELAWEYAIQAVEMRIPVLVAAKSDGRIESNWKQKEKKYRIRAVVQFAPDRKSLTAEAPAEYGRKGRRRPGYDEKLLSTLAVALERRIGREKAGPSPDLLPIPPPGRRVSRPRVRVRAEARYWHVSLGGLLEDNSGGINDTNVDFDDDLELGTSGIWRIGIGLDLTERITVDLSYMRGVFSENATLDEAEGFDGLAFPAGSRVSSVLTLNGVEAEFRYVFRDPDAEGAHPALLAGIQAISTHLKMEGVPGSGTSSFTPVSLAPGFELGDRSESGFFWKGRVHLLVGNTVGGQAELGLGFEIDRRFRIEAGYRYLALDDVYGPNPEYRLTLAGPFLGLGIRF